MSVAALQAASGSSTVLGAPAQSTAPADPPTSRAEPVPLPQPAPSEPDGVAADPRLTHLLRLSLDLQLDAMLFMLGAAAMHDLTPDGAGDDAIEPTTAAAAGSTALPWRRWMTEDLELTRRLASTAAELGLALPPTLGRAGRHTDSRLVAEDLMARYEFMSNLLGDLLDRAAVSTPRNLMEPVHDALSRSHSRMIELRAASAQPRKPQP